MNSSANRGHAVWTGLLLLGVMTTFAGPANAAPDDSALVTADYNLTSTIHFKRSNKYWIGTVSNFYVRIEESNSDFVESHASTDRSPADKIAHYHARWDYGTSGAPSIGSQSWPSVAEGNSFWDWAYTGAATKAPCNSDGNGGCGNNFSDASTKRNTVTYAFGDDHPTDIANVTAWVNAVWTDYGDLWEHATPEWVCPSPTPSTADATGDCGDVDVKDNALAGLEGSENHVWRLWAPADCPSPATGLHWENLTSGVYMAHPSTASNDGTDANLTLGASATPREVTAHANPMFGTYRIKRWE